MCTTDTPGDRTGRDDLGCVVLATGCAFPDHAFTTCIYALHAEAECAPLEGLAVNLLAVGKRCRRDGCRFCWESFGDKPTFTDPNGVDIPTACLPGSDVAAIRSSSSHPADNGHSNLRRSPCMKVVRFCSPAYAGLNGDDQSSVSDALQSLCCDESADVVLGATPKTHEIVEQAGCKSFEAVDAGLIPAIELAVESNEPADVFVLKHFIRDREGGKTKFDAELPCSCRSARVAPGVAWANNFQIPFATKKATESVCSPARCDGKTLRSYGSFRHRSHGAEI